MTEELAVSSKPRQGGVESFIKVAKESEHWGKPLPGVNGWTVGGLVKMLAQVGVLNQTSDTPDKIYKAFESEESQERSRELQDEATLNELHKNDSNVQVF